MSALQSLELAAASGSIDVPAGEIDAIAASIPAGAELWATIGSAAAQPVPLHAFPVLRMRCAFGVLKLRWSGVAADPIRVVIGQGLDIGVTV